MGLEKGERKSQPEIYESNSEGTDQRKQGIELIQVITKELRLDFVPPPPFLLILPKKNKQENIPGIRQDEAQPSRLDDPQKRNTKKKKNKKKNPQKNNSQGTIRHYDTVLNPPNSAVEYALY